MLVMQQALRAVARTIVAAGGSATEEAADLVFHLMAALVGAGVPWAGVEAELERRHR